MPRDHSQPQSKPSRWWALAARDRLLQLAVRAITAAALCTLAVATLDQLDRALPPDVSRATQLTWVLNDKTGEPLRYRLTPDGMLRLPVELVQVDQKFIAALIAFEDKRFYTHSGVDPLALLRAFGQWLQHAQVVSGGSTLTMQTVRLLEPRPRTVLSKVTEMLRAWQLERRYNKEQILTLYLTVAPYGGNVEGIRAATRYYFNKEPAALTWAEATLLVALPQSPSRLRPDRHPERALAARAKVLKRIAGRLPPLAQPLDASAERLAQREAIHIAPLALPQLAPHLSDRLFATRHEAGSCVERRVQAQAERIARESLGRLHPKANVAMLVIDNASAEVRAYVGGADYLNLARAGQLDLATATRSPGSTLKPLIYGLAFEWGLAAPATTVLDTPTRFGQYTPANFDGEYFGTVSLAEALRRSLNVPAVALMNAISPARFVSVMAEQHTPLSLPADASRPGLAVALGGAGISLEALARHYRAIADDGRVRDLQLICDRDSGGDSSAADVVARRALPMLGVAARYHLRRILRDVAVPEARIDPLALQQSARVAYKTGTSYGFRDAWAIGFDDSWTVAVWVGRPDGTSHPGHYGHRSAAPILFRMFDELPVRARAAPSVPDDVLLAWHAQSLPPAQRQLAGGDIRANGPRILFPIPGTTLLDQGGLLSFSAEGGLPPYTWLCNGVPVAHTDLARLQWPSPGPGFIDLTLIDAGGRYDKVAFRLAGLDSLRSAAGRLRTVE